MFGGISAEREVSIKSALEIMPVLEKDFNLQLIELNQLNFSSFVHRVKDDTLIFNALHGGEGENGQIQSFLSQAGIPYTGSDAMASMLAMNKHFTKIIAQENNILTPKWITFRLNNNLPSVLTNEKVKYPVVIKPNFQGSTLGLSIVHDKNSLDDALKLSSLYSNEILIEEFIEGRELTVGILGNRALDVVEIAPKSGIYDYHSKYTKGATDYHSPANLDDEISGAVKDQALKIYKALGCKNYARADFILDKNNKIYLLEINTLPGLSSTSLLPKSAKSKGIDFDQLISLIIKISILDNRPFI